MIFKENFEFLPPRREGDHLLPWVIGVMIFLSALALAFAIGLSNGLKGWSEDLSSSLSVQVIVDDNQERARQTNEAIKILRATPGIASAEPLAERDVLALLSPWLGDLPLGSDLPIPTLIDVMLIGDVQIDLEALEGRLRRVAPNASVDDHKVWLRQLLSLAGLIQTVLIGIVFMVGASTVSIVIFGCYAGLATHRESVDIMHLIGAEDAVIARAFDRRYMVHGVAGGFGGVIVAVGVLLLLASITKDLGAGLVTSVLPGSEVFVYLLLLPFVSGLVTMLTAHITVRRALGRMI